MAIERRARVTLLLALLPACAAARLSSDPAHLTHGVAAGEVTATSAVVWGRCDRAGALHVQIDGAAAASSVAVGEAGDFTGTVVLDGLAPATRYGYRAWCGDGSDAAGGGTFRTAPAPADAAPVRFAWGGDLGGQNVCRDLERGYPIFERIESLGLDLFIGLGDMIYADGACLPLGRYGNTQLLGPLPASTLDGYRAHWRYNRADPHFQRLLAAVPYFGVWDDHEIQDDSGPLDDTSWAARGAHLLPIALRAFLEYQPLVPPAGDPTRLYRSVRWGKHVELFILDTRQYRDALAAQDSETRPKTLLGAAQLAWLERSLAASDATWKVIVASVPLSIPTGSKDRDGFANGGAGTGYEREASRIFGALRANGIGDSLWITTDVHFATGFVLRPFADDPTWVAREYVSGPLNAGIFPNPRLDPTFNPERRFTYAPASADGLRYDHALGWFNFGVVEVAADGTLTVSIVNGRSERVFEERLSPARTGEGRRSASPRTGEDRRGATSPFTAGSRQSNVTRHCHHRSPHLTSPVARNGHGGGGT